MNKYKKLAFNTLLFSIGTFGSKLLSFLLVRFHTGILPEAQMSQANIIMQICFLLVPVATLSVEEALFRYGLDKSENKSRLYSTGFFSGVLGSILLFILLAPFLSKFPDTKNYVILMFISILSAGLRGINQQALRIQNKIKFYTYDGIQTTVLYFVFNILFMKFFKWGLVGYILSTGISDLFSALFIMLVGGTVRLLDIKKFSAKLLKKMLHYSLPLIPTFVLWWIVSAADLIMVRYMISEKANGLYTVSYKIPTLISLLATVFYKAWQMSATTELDTKKAAKFYTDVFTTYQSVMYISAAGLLLILKPLTNILTATAYHSAYIYSPLLVVATMMTCLCQFSGGIYTATKQSKHSLYTSLIAAVVNIVFNFILIPTIGVQGAALSTLLSYTICFFVRLKDTRKTIPYKSDSFKIFINLTTLSLMVIATLIKAGAFTNYLLILCFIGIFVLNYKQFVEMSRKLLKR